MRVCAEWEGMRLKIAREIRVGSIPTARKFCFENLKDIQYRKIEVMGYLYKITNKITGKCYIGVTIQADCQSRWRKHINSLRYKEGCPLLKKSMKKHGIENFTFDILIICFDEDVVKYEKEYIKKYNSQQPNGYNILSGGQIGDGLVGYKHSPETIEKIKEKIRQFREKNPHHFETYREKHKKSFEHIDFSSCVKNSEKFKKAMAERREQYRNGTKKMSDEYKKKISEGLRKYFNTDTPDRARASEKQKEIIRKALSKPVVQYTIAGVLVKEYPSIAEADRTSTVKKSNIQNVLSGKTKTAGGFVWKYKNQNILDS
jgi:group I intron endonuclease